MERLVHPNVVTCAGSRIDSNDHVIIVMELMGLGDLRNYLLSKYDHDAVVGPTHVAMVWNELVGPSNLKTNGYMSPWCGSERLEAWPDLPVTMHSRNRSIYLLSSFYDVDSFRGF
jgi:hypothetical protein